MTGTLGAQNSLRCRGYVYDTETGLYYISSRYYDPEICRFINADGYASTGQGLLGGNAFAYCLNCPVMGYDPSGCRPIWEHDYGKGVIGYTDTGTGRARDVTDEVDAALVNYIPYIKYLSALKGALLPVKYVAFAFLVYKESLWDIKVKKSWEKTIGTLFPGNGVYVMYHGVPMTPEDLGNYTYGVLGKVFDIPLVHLKVGSFVVAGFPLSGAKYENEMKDWLFITFGYLMGYPWNIKQYIYRGE